MGDLSNNNIELSVIIPTFNEEECIEEVIRIWSESFTSLKINYRIHFYDGGSIDNTNIIIENHPLFLKRIFLHTIPGLLHGPSILLGYNENTDSDWIFQTDSDNEMSPTYFKELWNNREHYDFLIGERIKRNQPFSRKIISFISRAAVKLFFGTGVDDVNSPYRLMRTVSFNNYFKSMPKDTLSTNILISGIVNRYKIKLYKCNVTHQFRQTGTVSLKNMKLLKYASKSLLQTVLYSFNLSKVI